MAAQPADHWRACSSKKYADLAETGLAAVRGAEVEAGREGIVRRSVLKRFLREVTRWPMAGPRGAARRFLFGATFPAKAVFGKNHGHQSRSRVPGKTAPLWVIAFGFDGDCGLP